MTVNKLFYWTYFLKQVASVLACRGLGGSFCSFLIFHSQYYFLMNKMSLRDLKLNKNMHYEVCVLTFIVFQIFNWLTLLPSMALTSLENISLGNFTVTYQVILFLPWSTIWPPFSENLGKFPPSSYTTLLQSSTEEYINNLLDVKQINQWNLIKVHLKMFRC